MTRIAVAAALAALVACADDPTGGDPGDPDGGAGQPDAPGGGGGDGGPGPAPSGLVFGPYKDTSIHMNWNTNVISTQVSGPMMPLAAELAANGGKTVTLSFATGECGNESWGGIPGAAMATANVAGLTAAGVDYLLATGGAAGSFTCGSDAGFMTFIDRWMSPHLVGFDAEATRTLQDAVDAAAGSS